MPQARRRANFCVSSIKLSAAAATLVFWTSGGFAQVPTIQFVAQPTITVKSTGGTINRQLQDRLSDQLSVLDFNAKCDGSTNDSTAVAQAMANGSPIRVPANKICVATSLAAGTIVTNLIGPGQIQTTGTDGVTSLRGPVSYTMSAPPASRINLDDPELSFTGDIHNVPRAVEMTVTGAGTVPVPAQGYNTEWEASAEYIVYNVDGAGGNTSNIGNGGRTGVSALNVRANQYGGGDVGAFGCVGLVATSNPNASGISGFLAQPAVGCMGGMLTAAAPSYIEGIGDIDIDDGFPPHVYDAAAAGTVFNFTRHIATEALGANWVGDIRQNTGPAPMDFWRRDLGAAVAGYDQSGSQLTAWRLAHQPVIANAGQSYTVGDLVIPVGGTWNAPLGTPTAFQVNAVLVNGQPSSTPGASGPVAGLTVYNGGIYPISPPAFGPLSTVSTAYAPGTSGAGTGLTVQAEWVQHIADILPYTGGCTYLGDFVGSTNYQTTVGLPGNVATCLDTDGTFQVGDANAPSLKLLPNAVLQVSNHILSTGALPSLNVGSNSCTNGTVEPGSTDNAGAIDFPAANTSNVCAVTFATPFSVANGHPAGHPFCVFTAKAWALAVPLIQDGGDSPSFVAFARADFGPLASTNNTPVSVTYRCE